MNGKAFYIVAALAACVLLSACRPTWFDIQLTPDGAVMEREISQKFGPEELERIALLYGQEISEDTLAKFEEESVVSTSLTGRFQGRMPDDSHNSGLLLHCESPLGSASMYTERFGGRNDLAVMFRDQEKALNLFWDIGLLLLDDLVGHAPDYEELRSFLDTTMRADAWDLALEMTVSDFGADSMANLSWMEDTPDDALPMIMRALHFVESRGYVRLDGLFRELHELENNGDTWSVALQLVGTAIGRRMGLDDEAAMPNALVALGQYPEEELEDRIEQFIDGDENVARLIAEYREKYDGTTTPDTSESMEILAKQLFLFDFDLLDIGGDARRVTLFVAVEPYQTNGVWFEATEPVESVTAPDEVVVFGDSQPYVEWSYPLADNDPRGGDLAQIVYAFWAEPAEQFQLERFGRIVLDKEPLETHCRWRENLDAPLRAEWDTFIAGLQPGPELEATLRSFQFSTEAEAEQSDDPDKVSSRIAYDVIGRLARAVKSDR